MNIKKFVFGTYELGLLRIYTRNELMDKAIEAGYSFLDTSVCYNNDYDVNYWKGAIISKMPPQMVTSKERYDFYVTNHLRNLKRNQLDVMLIHNPRSNWELLAECIINDDRIKEVGVSNFNVQQIKDFKEKFGFYPKYNEIEVSPIYTDLETINFCKENNIKIISYCIFGGKYNALRTISNYSLPRLFAYLDGLVDYCIVRTNSIDEFNQTLRAAQLNGQFEFDYKQNTDNKVMNPTVYTPAVFGSVELTDGVVVPTYSKYICDRELNLDYPEKVYSQNEVTEEISDICYIINKAINSIDLNDYNLEFLTDYQVLYRYTIEEALDKSKYFHNIKTGYNHDFLNIHYKNMLVFTFNVYLIKNGNLNKVNNEGTEIKLFKYYR